MNGNGRTLRARAIGLVVAACSAVSAPPVPPAYGQEVADTGVIVGQLVVPRDFPEDAVLLAVLMPPRWALIWNTEVQQRIDTYFANNIAAVNENRDLFGILALRARREATEVVVARMRVELDEAFSASVRAVSGNGAFEFAGVPFGDYRIVAIGQAEGTTAIWAQSATVRSPVPEFVDMGVPFR